MRGGMFGRMLFGRRDDCADVSGDAGDAAGDAVGDAGDVAGDASGDAGDVAGDDVGDVIENGKFIV